MSEDAQFVLISQVKTALSIISRRRSVFDLDPKELALLKCEFERIGTPEQEKEVLIACEEVLLEVLLAAIPSPPAQVDLWEVAVNLLHKISEYPNKTMPIKDALIAPELIDQFVREGVILKLSDHNGIRWGRNANQAIGRYNAEQAGTPPPVIPMTPPKPNTHTKGNWDE